MMYLKYLMLHSFPAKHSFIGHLVERFTEEYPTDVTKNKSLKFNFHEIAWAAYRNLSLSQPIHQAQFNLKKISSISASRSLHFGTLSFDARVRKVKAANLGDEIQGFPGLQFLPYVDFFVERDKLENSKGEQKITTFFNAWWGDPYSSWPPPINIEPIMISVHVDSGNAKIVEKRHRFSPKP